MHERKNKILTYLHFHLINPPSPLHDLKARNEWDNESEFELESAWNWEKILLYETLTDCKTGNMDSWALF